MFGEKYELKSLYDNKSELIRGKVADVGDGFCESTSTESAFLGPVLWDDTYTINDLDNINLEEFSPAVFYEPNNGENSWVDDFSPDEKVSDRPTEYGTPMEQKIQEVETFKQIDLNTWTNVPSVPNLDPNVIPLPYLKPPVTRKASRVPTEQKNEKYWNRRMKNNASAKRSRDARRMMENQVYVKAALLERENAQLRLELERARAENKTLRDLISGPSSNHTAPAPSLPEHPILRHPTVLNVCSNKLSTPVHGPVSIPSPPLVALPDSTTHTVHTPRLHYRLIQPRCPKV